MLSDWMLESYPDMVRFDGFDDAMIGVCARIGQETIIAYDYEKCVMILINEHDMTREEAVEYFDFNVAGTYAGEHTPCFITMNDEDQKFGPG